MSRRKFIHQAALTGFGIFTGRELLSNENWLKNTHGVVANKLIRFVVASDGHYGQPNTDYKTYHRNFIELVNKLHKEDAFDFCVINGDIIHDNPQFLPEAKQTFDTLAMPYYVTQGNHDRCTPAVWEQVWGMPTNYSVVIKDQVLLLATTSNEKGDYCCADINWVKEQLEKYRSKKAVYVFIHITPEKWTDNGVACEALHKLFSEHKNIVAVFNGHDHDQDHFRYKNNIPFLFDGHIGGNWGLPYRGFRVVEFRADNKLYTYMMNPLEKLNEARF